MDNCGTSTEVAALDNQSIDEYLALRSGRAFSNMLSGAPISLVNQLISTCPQVPIRPPCHQDR